MYRYACALMLLFPLFLTAKPSSQPASQPVKEIDPWNKALRVSMGLGGGPYVAGGSFDLNVTVKNVSDNVQKFKVMSCSWPEHWRADSRYLTVPMPECAKNVEHEMELAPGKTWGGTISLPIAADAPAGPLAFRMSFSPAAPKALLFSDSVTIVVAPEGQK